MTTRQAGPAHLFTVDVEEHFHVTAFERHVSRDAWGAQPSRVAIGTERLLDLLARHEARGTFFILGWVAERQPALVRRIAEAGHEVASHGHWHRRITTLSPDEFRADLRESRQAIEQAAGVAVRGFRAPSFSIVRGCEWALEILVEEGYAYDSSLFPIHRPDYGYAGILPEPHDIATQAGRLLELPLATATLAGARLPAAGGGYLRQFPLGLMRRALRQHEALGIPAMCYIHPWELDPGQPRLPVSWLTRVRHYRNLDVVEQRLDALMREFRFTSVERWREVAGPRPTVTLDVRPAVPA